jgi:hypothetical protein
MRTLTIARLCTLDSRWRRRIGDALTAAMALVASFTAVTVMSEAAPPFLRVPLRPAGTGRKPVQGSGFADLETLNEFFLPVENQQMRFTRRHRLPGKKPLVFLPRPSVSHGVSRKSR